MTKSDKSKREIFRMKIKSFNYNRLKAFGNGMKFATIYNKYEYVLSPR